MPTGPLTMEHYPWDELTPEQVIERLIYDLYGPVSSLGAELDRLASGEIDENEEDLDELLENMRSHVKTLSRLVVALKRYHQDSRNPPSERA